MRQDRRVAEVSAALRSALEGIVQRSLLPRSQIDVFVQVLSADGGARACALNACVLALADAGVPLRALAAGCGGLLLQGSALLDPNHAEASGGATAALDAALALAQEGATGGEEEREFVWLDADARVDAEQFHAVLDLAAAGCEAVGGFMRATMVRHAKRLAAARQAA